MPRKPSILLVNDDGIDAPGLQALRRALGSAGYEIMVSAPMYERSGAGCSLSLAEELEVEPRRETPNATPWGYAVNGTPVECVKFALGALELKPDLVLSGINRGMNLGDAVFYSGTVAGAIESCFNGFRAMATSLACWGEPVAHYDDAATYIAGMVPWLLEQPFAPRRFWNLNLPNRRLHDYGPLTLASHGTTTFADHYSLFREEGGRCFYRNAGSEVVAGDEGPDADEAVISRGDVALSLLSIDLGGMQGAPDLEPLRAALAPLAKTHRRPAG